MVKEPSVFELSGFDCIHNINKIISFLSNPFFPEFLKWTHPSLNLDMSIVANNAISQKTKRNGKQF